MTGVISGLLSVAITFGLFWVAFFLREAYRGKHDENPIIR